MGLESGDKISDLNPLWPLGSDPKSQGDDHIRLIKKVMQTDVPPIEDVVLKAGDSMQGDLLMEQSQIEWFGSDDTVMMQTLYSDTMLADNASWGLTPRLSDDSASDFARGLRFDYLNRVWYIGRASDVGDVSKVIVTNNDLQSGSNWRIVAGILECWGVGTANKPQTITFPQTFASPPSVQSSTVERAGNRGAHGYDVTTTGFTLTVQNADGDDVNMDASWYAIGEAG